MLFCSSSKGQKTSIQQYANKIEHWDNLNLNNLSPDGQWFSYTLFNHEDGDRLILQNTETGKTYNFKHPKNSKFHNNQWYSVITDDETILINLKKGYETSYQNPLDFELANNNQFLVLLKESDLKIVNNESQSTIFQMSDVIQFKLSPSKDKIVYVQKVDSIKKLGLIDFSTLKNTTITYLSNDFTKMTFNQTGEGLALFEIKPENEPLLLYFDLINNKKYKLNNSKYYSFNPNGNFNLIISKDSEKVFFSVLEKSLALDYQNKSQPEIWSGDSKLTFLQENVFCESQNNNRLAVWYPKSGEFSLITNDNCDKVILSKNNNFAIIFNTKKYEPQFDYFGPVDFKIKNIKSNNYEIFLSQHSGNTNYILPSLTEKYVAYYKNKNWFIYDIQQKKHKNITKSIKANWESNINDFNGETLPFGLAGWANNDKHLLLYDEWDIWRINIQDGKAKRLTNGKEKEIKFRLISPFTGKINSSDGYIGNELFMSNYLLIEANGSDGRSGYFKWDQDHGLKEIIYKTAKIDQIIHEQDLFLVREQRFDTPPRIVKISQLGNPKHLFQSNPHYTNNDKRKVEVIHYKTKIGKNLKGLLYYPINYKSNKKYPMVVNIYEKMFKEYHQYHIPTNVTSVGFNVANYINDGYFVLLPDIYYEIGEVGKSATDCVIAAVKEAQKNKSINKIGLIGHSFGGYEANFIITQTDIFDAAVSSAGVSDVVSYYLNLNWNNGRPDYWRFEFQQWRMGKSLFEDRNRYYRNSPISFSENIKTPLLHWTGKNDFHVNWQQSMLWYLALRRLNKKQVLLLYPEEGHILLDKHNQIDLTFKVKKWFDFYLKEDSSVNLEKIF